MALRHSFTKFKDTELLQTIAMSDSESLEALQKEISDLRKEIENLEAKHQGEMKKLKSENYDALEACQTRYQAEISIQRENFEKRLRTAQDSFDI